MLTISVLKRTFSGALASGVTIAVSPKTLLIE